MNVRHAAACCVAAFAIAPVALADVVEMRYTGTGRGQSVRITRGESAVNTFAGQLIHVVDSATGRGELLIGARPMFCTDLYQYTSAQKKTYQVGPLTAAPDSNPMDRHKAAALRDLFATAGGAQFDIQGSNDFAAAFQLAVWEIVSDYDSDVGRESLDLSDGWFQARSTSGNAISSGIASQVSSFFDAVGSDGEFAGLVALTSPAAQDQLTVIPSTGSSGVLAAGLLLAVSRRRR